MTPNFGLLIVILVCCFIIGLAYTTGIPIPELRWVCTYCGRSVGPFRKRVWWALTLVLNHPVTALQMLRTRSVPLACEYCEERRQRGETLEKKKAL